MVKLQTVIVHPALNRATRTPLRKGPWVKEHAGQVPNLLFKAVVLLLVPVVDDQIRSSANRTPSPPTAAAAQTLLFPSCTPSSSGAALPSPVNAFPPLRTSYLFPFFPCPMAPIPLAFIIQPSLLSALLGCQRKKGPRSFFFNLPSGLASAS